jgi:hypothetical protein
MRAAWLILLAGCYRSTPVAPALSNKADQPEVTALVMSSHGVGPIDSASKATLTDLRAKLIGYEVRPINDGSLEYDIYKDGEKLAYVVPDDQSGYVFNIHAVSSKVEISGHPWRVGRAFGDAAHLTNCECWGPNPTCYTMGDHLAVNFDRECDDLTTGDRHALRALDGQIVQRVIWSPSAFGEDSGEDND